MHRLLGSHMAQTTSNDDGQKTRTWTTNQTHQNQGAFGGQDNAMAQSNNQVQPQQQYVGEQQDTNNSYNNMWGNNKIPTTATMHNMAAL